MAVDLIFKYEIEFEVSKLSHTANFYCVMLLQNDVYAVNDLLSV